MAENDVETVRNPVIVPEKPKFVKQKKETIKEIRGVALPDGLEIPGHWGKDLKRVQLEDDEDFDDVRPK